MKRLLLLIIGVMGGLSAAGWGEEPDEGAGDGADGTPFASILRPLLAERCAGCHGEAGRPEGDVNLAGLSQVQQLLGRPDLIQTLIDVVESRQMPPEPERALEPAERERALASLRQLRRLALRRGPPPRTPIRRMTRFQYANAVQDLFQLRVLVFPLPERMMREHGNYFKPETGVMPEVVRVGSRPLGKSQLIEQCLGGVTPFPQDLRAEHGFDNQADHLTLSPLLLEAFLRLGRSIVESGDFNPRTCGVWAELFADPGKADPGKADLGKAGPVGDVVRGRLRLFLTRAFRRPVDAATLERYVEHVAGQVQDGVGFTTAMKSAAAAAIASPQFLYLYETPREDREDRAGELDEFALASRLSFLLWGSLPDQPLLELASAGQLSRPEVLAGEVRRMLHDRRVKRFCDSFPAQWLQLERIVSSTPDPARFPQFYFLKYRASMHMMLEPLLLFETVLVENRSILTFLDADFSYRSELLEAWYRDGSQGRPGAPTVLQFRRVPVDDRRQGGLITNAAVMTMTSGPQRTKPITRGAWMASVIWNDPPQPPPADVPPLSDSPTPDEARLTLRERLVAHRQRADCAGCHQQIDPLGFALENYGPAGFWRDTYDDGLPIDASGKLFRRQVFAGVIEFKDALLQEKDRFARALAEHLLSFALGREVGVWDASSVDQIVREAAADDYRFQSLIEHVVLSDSFRGGSEEELPGAEPQPPVNPPVNPPVSSP